MAQRLSIISGPAEPALLDCTFNDVLHARCKHHPQNVAVVSLHQNKAMTYADLQQQSDLLASGLYELGVRQGDRVGVLLGNRYEYVIVSLSQKHMEL